MALVEDQFENTENIRLQERINFIVECYEKFGGESYILEVDNESVFQIINGKMIFRVGDKFIEQNIGEKQNSQNQKSETIKENNQEAEKSETKKTEEQKI